jgi:hypothetical protein
MGRRTITRDEIAVDFVQSADVERILEVAELVMKYQAGVKFDDDLTVEREEIVDWIEGLDAEQLAELQQIAERLERGTIH